MGCYITIIGGGDGNGGGWASIVSWILAIVRVTFRGPSASVLLSQRSPSSSAAVGSSCLRLMLYLLRVILPLVVNRCRGAIWMQFGYLFVGNFLWIYVHYWFTTSRIAERRLHV